MKNLIKFLVLSSVFTLFFACSKSEGGDASQSSATKSGSAIEAYEDAIMKEAKEIESMSFSCPTQVDADLKVEGMTEEVQWLYAKYPDLGSPLVKKVQLGKMLFLNILQHLDILDQNLT